MKIEVKPSYELSATNEATQKEKQKRNTYDRNVRERKKERTNL